MSKHVVALWHNHAKAKDVPGEFKRLFGFSPQGKNVSIRPRNWNKKQPAQRGKE